MRRDLFSFHGTHYVSTLSKLWFSPLKRVLRFAVEEKRHTFSVRGIILSFLSMFVSFFFARHSIEGCWHKYEYRLVLPVFAAAIIWNCGYCWSKISWGQSFRTQSIDFKRNKDAIIKDFSEFIASLFQMCEAKAESIVLFRKGIVLNYVQRVCPLGSRIALSVEYEFYLF